MAKCKSCGAEIIWIKTKNGKAMPCDPEEIVYWQKKGGSRKIVTPNGEVISAELEGIPGTETGIGYISHFATCPNADSHRSAIKNFLTKLDKQLTKEEWINIRAEMETRSIELQVKAEQMLEIIRKS